MSETAIELSGLTKRFGATVAVNDVTLAVELGQCFGLIGPNGAGKTTTFSMMCGFLRPTAGTLRVLGRAPVPAAARSSARWACCRRTRVLPAQLGGGLAPDVLGPAVGICADPAREAHDGAGEGGPVRGVEYAPRARSRTAWPSGWPWPRR